MTNDNLDSKMGKCAVLSNGQTIIYLDADDGKHWVEPCFIQSYKDSKVGFMPLQIFGESYLAEPVNPSISCAVTSRNLKLRMLTRISSETTFWTHEHSEIKGDEYE